MTIRWINILCAALVILLSSSSFGQFRKDSIKTMEVFHLFQEYEYTDSLKARAYSDSCLFYARKSGSKDLIARAYQFKGWYFQDCSKFHEANKMFYKSLALFKQVNNRQGVADAYGNLGNSYLDMDEFQKSLDYQLLSLSENEKIIKGNPSEDDLAWALEGKTYALHNIGAIYKDIGLYDKALEYEYKSISHEIETGNTVGVAISYNSLASIYKELGQIDSAIYYFNGALKLYEKEDYPFGRSATLQAYAAMEGSNLTDLQKKEMMEESLRLRRGMGDVDGETRTLIEIGEAWFDELSDDSLSKIVETVYTLINENELDFLNEKYFRLYSRYSSRIGKYQNAYFALENFLELKAISDENKRTHDLIARDIRYQLEQKHYNDSLEIQHSFTLERLEDERQMSRLQNIIYLSVIGFIVLIVSLWIIVNKNRRRKRLNDLLSEKNILIQDQKEIVEEKNRSISDSINYAKRLQTAILPTRSQVNECLPNSFLFFEPKDVVSGDFHWFEKKGDQIYIAAADCTGHGVPGALVSIVCSNALNRAVNEFNITAPAEILNKTRKLVIEQFDTSVNNVVDGMDIALLAIDVSENVVRFAGANNPLWIVRDNAHEMDATADVLLTGTTASLMEFKGDKQPVGMHEGMVDFTERTIAICPNDALYLFSDGYADQFGGENGKKFKYRPFKEMLMEIYSDTMEQQEVRLRSTFAEWKGDLEQIDDVCVIGIRLNPKG